MRAREEILAEFNRWKERVRECRFRRTYSKTKSEREDQTIEAAYAAIIVGALGYALGMTPSAAVRIKVE